MTVFLLDRTVLRLSGPDARAFLDTLITQNLDRLDGAPCLYAGLLSPQGKVQTDMIVWADGADALFVETDSARGGDLMRRLMMFKLRAAVDIEEVSDAYAVLAGFDGAEGPADPRRPGGDFGWRRVVARADAEAAPSDLSAYHRRRIEIGLPDLVLDAGPEEVFALEALFEELNGVDFKKGCFVGQENVSRMKRRATTRKKFCPVVFEGAALASGTPVVAGAATLGDIRTGFDGRALALIRLDRAREALRKGEPLHADGRAIALDAPAWLLQPADEDA